MMKNLSKLLINDEHPLYLPAGLLYGLVVADRLLALEFPNLMTFSAEGFASDRNGTRGSAGVFIENNQTMRGVRITVNLACGDIRVYFGDRLTIAPPLFTPCESLEPSDWDRNDIDELCLIVRDYLVVENYTAIETWIEKIKSQKHNEAITP
jgi:hypothetical protein